jgi:hypothetical protein
LRRSQRSVSLLWRHEGTRLGRESLMGIEGLLVVVGREVIVVGAVLRVHLYIMLAGIIQ